MNILAWFRKLIITFFIWPRLLWVEIPWLFQANPFTVYILFIFYLWEKVEAEWGGAEWGWTWLVTVIDSSCWPQCYLRCDHWPEPAPVSTHPGSQIWPWRCELPGFDGFRHSVYKWKCPNSRTPILDLVKIRTDTNRWVSNTGVMRLTHGGFHSIYSKTRLKPQLWV